MTEKIKTRIRKEAAERIPAQPTKESEVSFGPNGMLNLNEMFKSLNIGQNSQRDQVYENQKLMSDIGKLFFTSMMKFNHLINTHTNASDKSSINTIDPQIKVEESRVRSSKSARNARNGKNQEGQRVADMNTSSTDGMPSGQYRNQNKNKFLRQSNNAAQTTDKKTDRVNSRPGAGKQKRSRASQESALNNGQVTESQTWLPTDRSSTPNKMERAYSIKEKLLAQKEILQLDRVPTHRDAAGDPGVSMENKLTPREGEYGLSTECEHMELGFSDFQAPTPNSNEKQKLNLNIYRFINSCVAIKDYTTTDTHVERPEVLSTLTSIVDESEESTTRGVSYASVVTAKGTHANKQKVSSNTSCGLGELSGSKVERASADSGNKVTGNASGNTGGDVSSSMNVGLGSKTNVRIAINTSGNVAGILKDESGVNPQENSGSNSHSGGVDRTSSNQDTLLMLCFGGDLESVKKLKGIDLEFVDQVGRSAIHYACTSGNLELVRYLISNNVNIDRKDVKGWTPLFIAVVNSHVDIARLLLDHGADLTLTLRHRCAPTRLTDAHSNAIHFAAIKMNRDMTELLLSKNVDVNQKDSQGITPLSYACNRGDYAYVAYLLDAGANPTIQDVNGRTSFHSVALGGSLEVAKLLYERVGVHNAQDRWSLTPSKLAQIRGNEELSQFLSNPSRFLSGQGTSRSRGPEAGGTGSNPLGFDAMSVNSDESDDMYSLLATTIASALGEPNSDQIYRCLTRLGTDVVKTLFDLTMKVEKSGGVTTADGKRSRTPGGVFFTLLKQMHLNNYITKEDYQYIRAAEKERLKSIRNSKVNMTTFGSTNTANKYSNSARINRPSNNRNSKASRISKVCSDNATQGGHNVMATKMSIGSSDGSISKLNYRKNINTNGSKVSETCGKERVNNDFGTRMNSKRKNTNNTSVNNKLSGHNNNNKGSNDSGNNNADRSNVSKKSSNLNSTNRTGSLDKDVTKSTSKSVIKRKGDNPVNNTNKRAINNSSNTNRSNSTAARNRSGQSQQM